MPSQFLLDKEQEELLFILVEASRNVPFDKRQDFLTSYEYNSERVCIVHNGFNTGEFRAYMGDVEILATNSFIYFTEKKIDTSRFFITPLGYKYYEQLNCNVLNPTQGIEKTVIEYLNSEKFKQLYPEAFKKWAQAEQLLWKSDTSDQLTIIGHLCRESVQEFAEQLICKYNLKLQNQNKAHVVKRINAVLKYRGNQLSSTVLPFLDSLLNYWGCLSDLIQRQEHGNQKEGRTLVWKDAKRVVFHTAILMYEIDASLE